eukprot:TRINITY_DN23459_c0_g1_i1.p1 TRINITY_DN23459_c0_g1~~TRINITY_DN23459_c0_g1_i1.p1  ORF type:complete len:115 (+),score=5.11 TRINITY_DN23459_c0_g1_i1:138-482(+)
MPPDPFGMLIRFIDLTPSRKNPLRFVVSVSAGTVLKHRNTLYFLFYKCFFFNVATSNQQPACVTKRNQSWADTPPSAVVLSSLLCRKKGYFFGSPFVVVMPRSNGYCQQSIASL